MKLLFQLRMINESALFCPIYRRGWLSVWLSKTGPWFKYFFTSCHSQEQSEGIHSPYKVNKKGFILETKGSRYVCSLRLGETWLKIKWQTKLRWCWQANYMAIRRKQNIYGLNTLSKTLTRKSNSNQKLFPSHGPFLWSESTKKAKSKVSPGICQRSHLPLLHKLPSIICPHDCWKALLCCREHVGTQIPSTSCKTRVRLHAQRARKGRRTV